jgi:hypothetical protein
MKPDDRFPPSRNRPLWPSLSAALAGLLLLSAAPTGPGRDPPPSPPALRPEEVSRLITQLDADDFRARQEAARRLRQGGLAVRPALIRALRDKGRSLEMRRRLQEIADDILGFQVHEPLNGTKDAWGRLGYAHRMFVIDNAWDLRRYRRILPKLPRVDLRKRHLLVVASWASRPRMLLPPEQDGDTLVVRVREGRVDKDTGLLDPPEFLLAEVVAWPGPVRFEVNGEVKFTRWKGEQLKEEAGKRWAEIKRLHDGGRPTQEQRVAAAQPQWGEGTPDPIIVAALAKKPVSRDEMKGIFVQEFRRLADMGAWPVVPDIFRLAETMAEFDPAFGPACLALGAIGGPEVVAGCARAIRSKNRFAQHLGVAVACDLGLPELRPVFHRGLASSYEPVVRGAMNGLTDLGLSADDVPPLVGVLKRVDSFGDDGDVVQTAIGHLASLGAKAAPALPELEQLRTHRIEFIRKPAAAACARIRAAGG